MQIQVVGEGQYRIHAGSHAVEIGREQFEDLFYSAETNATAWYRVLVDSVCQSADERAAMTAMINAGDDMEAVLGALQAQVREIGL
jgi:hypothetical protein